MAKLVLFFIVITLLSFRSIAAPLLINDQDVYKQITIYNDTLTWKQLGDIRYVTKSHPDYGEVDYPQVNQLLKTRQGKEIIISGFAIPIDSKSFALSKNVFASCFFCGKSGPETIMGIHFKSDDLPKLKTDQYITLKGKFRYNETNVDDWIYHIDEAVIIDGN